MAEYKVGDVLQFGNEWLLVLDQPGIPNVTIQRNDLFLGGYNPITDFSSIDSEVLFNIFDIKRKVEDNEY